MPMSAIKYKCNKIWNINVNATYYDYAKMICDLVMTNGAVLNKEECMAVISCCLTAVSYTELYYLFNMYVCRY